MWPGGRAIFPLASFPGTTKFLGAAFSADLTFGLLLSFLSWP